MDSSVEVTAVLSCVNQFLNTSRDILWVFTVEEVG